MKIIEIIEIREQFELTEDDIKLLHPLDWLKLIKDIHSFLENQIKTLKKECASPFKWQYFKNEIIADWGKWSHKSNKILKNRIKDTEKDKVQKLNIQYKYVYQYWWQTNFHLELVSLFIHISQKKQIKYYLNNRKELEKTIKKVK